MSTVALDCQMVVGTAGMALLIAAPDAGAIGRRLRASPAGRRAR